MSLRHQITRKYSKVLLGLAGLLMAGACADNAPLAPTNVKSVKAPANFTQVGSSVTFRVDNSEGIVKQVGSHVISIPAGAICDPMTSGYGTSMWDQACDAMRGSIVITATMFSGPNGEPYVDFEPAMRFAPEQNVMLFLLANAATTPVEMNVKYCDNLGYCVDESIADESLRPFHVTNSSIIGRRVKHFSGYVVVSGEECTGTVVDNGDGTYWCENGGGMERRSGYMVASGEDITDVMKDAKKGKDEQ
jgi:hypothetical protein